MGDSNYPGITIWMAGKVAADRSIVIWSGFISQLLMRRRCMLC